MPEKSPPGWGFIRKWLEKLAVKHAVDIDIGEFRDHMDSSVSASENWDKAKKYLYERYGIVCGADEERMRRAIIESAEDEEKKYVQDRKRRFLYKGGGLRAERGCPPVKILQQYA